MAIKTKDAITGQQDVTTTPAQLATIDGYGYLVKNMSTSTTTIFVGGEDINTTGGGGFELEIGAAINLEVPNADRIYVVAAATGARVCWIGERL